VLPTALGQLMALDPNDASYFDRLLRLIESEPNFSARVLANANSPSGLACTSCLTARLDATLESTGKPISRANRMKVAS
jgi:hypothetical protein